MLGSNGNVEGKGYVSGTPQSDTSVPLTIGRCNNTNIVGNIRAIRITKGICRYTTNFNLPEAPFPIK